MANPASGIIAFVNLFKPPGMTSAHAAARVRHLFDRAPVGHLGTLDPQAAGVLPLAVGGATRLIPFVTPRSKTYVFVLRLGASTASGDRWSDVRASAPVPDDWRSRLRVAAAGFVGEVEQVPPMVSALKVEGRRLYDLARDGREVPRRSRTVHITRLSVLGFEERAARMVVDCSAGTYVRTLCEDLARAVGTEGHLATLLRTRSGPFRLSGARRLEEVERDPGASVLGATDVLALPIVVLEGRAARDFCAGRIVPLAAPVAERYAFVLDAARSPLGVGENLGTLLQPRKVFT